MKLYDLNKKTIKKISDKELLRLHSRIHQLFGGSKKRKTNPDFIDFLKSTHTLIVDEMIKRKMNHKSLLEFYLFLLNLD